MLVNKKNTDFASSQDQHTISKMLECKRRTFKKGLNLTNTGKKFNHTHLLYK